MHIGQNQVDSIGQHVTIGIGTRLKYNLTSYIIAIYQELSCDFHIFSLVKDYSKLFRDRKGGKIIRFYKFIEPYSSKTIVLDAFKDKMFLIFN